MVACADAGHAQASAVTMTMAAVCRHRCWIISSPRAALVAEGRDGLSDASVGVGRSAWQRSFAGRDAVQSRGRKDRTAGNRNPAAAIPLALGGRRIHALELFPVFGIGGLGVTQYGLERDVVLLRHEVHLGVLAGVVMRNHAAILQPWNLRDGITGAGWCDVAAWVQVPRSAHHERLGQIDRIFLNRR